MPSKRTHVSLFRRIVGAMTYLGIVVVLTPVISVMVCGLIHGLLDATGLSTELAGYLMFVVMPLVGLVVIRFAVRDYQQRTASPDEVDGAN